MAQRYLLMFGDEVELFLDAVDRGIPKSIRINTLVSKSVTETANSLKSRGFKLKEVPYIDYAFYIITEPFSIGATEEHLTGQIYVQGVGSMLASLILSPTSEDLVADLASAPGGKTTHMAQIMNNLGCILSVDKSNERVSKLRANIQRLGVKNTVVLRRDILELTGFEGIFSKALLDAPCTGEGLMVYMKERKLIRGAEELRKMSRLQVQLLDKAIDLLNKEGVLLYATCSIAPEENEYVISEVLSRRKDVSIIQTRYPGVKGKEGLTSYNEVNFHEDMSKCLRLYPHLSGTEGFFLCLMRRQ